MRHPNFLTGGVIIALLFSAACSKNNDSALSADLSAKIAADADLKAAGVTAQVKDGQITLTGTVPSSDIELKAVKLANSTPGVKKVTDQLKVQPPPGALDAYGNPVSSQPAASSAPPPQETAAPQQPSTPEPAPESAPAPQQPPAAAPQPATITIPSGQVIAIRMIDSIDSARNAAGQQFRASLSSPIRARGKLVAPVGTDVRVQLSHAASAGRVTGRSELEIRLVSISIRGQRYSLVSNRYRQVGASRGKQTAKRTGIGTAAGAIIGAIAGGGKGAAIGAAVGGGGTATYQVLTRGKQVRIPSETRLEFTLQAPVVIQLP